MSEYEKLKQKGMGRGRPRHTSEQRAQSRQVNALRQEARRRAHLVLKGKHRDEFQAIYESEIKALENSLSPSNGEQGKKARKK